MNTLTSIGVPQASGSYVLHLQVTADLWVRYGRYQQGRPIFTPSGDYVYIGSAMGGAGAMTLAWRLLRHTSRANGPPQPIRAVLSELFQSSPPTHKKLRWHVDYLVEETAVAIPHITLIYSHLPLEKAIAQLLNAQPAFVPLSPGLGATDHPGCTHLLRVQTAVDLKALLTSMTFVSP